MLKVSVLVDGEIKSVLTNSLALIGDIIHRHYVYLHSLKADDGKPFQPPRSVQILGVA
ncbi:MAG: hypothetical protein NXH70_02220 [Hyphomonas sp.]|nr:hypothetical protein [Hyphomonas sp.]